MTRLLARIRVSLIRRFLVFGGVVELATIMAITGSRYVEAVDIDFARDVRPILSDNCYLCHGPSEESRESELRLDHREDATRDLGGYAGIVPGDATESEVMRRITSSDEWMAMPPPASGKSLTADEIRILRQWINEGAKWSDHWAFVPPTRPRVPSVGPRDPPEWTNNPIDAFVLKKLHSAQMTPSPQASRETLLRRLYLDLLGLPPTPDEQEVFLNDSSEDAFSRLVERLLASPHYGERWGRHWLDAARYSDSDGYEKDLRRDNWFYRDWVVNALNDDKPYDQFVIEQVAGDLLSEAGQAERIATGFLRNSMVNEEGGADPEQFRVEALFDRIDALGKSVLGLTVQCAQCHTHKYDPLTHEDYFGMFAYLNNCHEEVLAVFSTDELAAIKRIEAEIAAIEQQLRDRKGTWRDELLDWAKAQSAPPTSWHVLRLERLNWTGQKFEFLEDGSIISRSFAPSRERNDFFSNDLSGTIRAVRLELLTHPDLPRHGPGRSVFGANALSEFELTYVDSEGGEHKLEIASASANVQVDRRPINQHFAKSPESENRTEGPINDAIDGDQSTAWTTQTNAATRNQSREAVFVLTEPFDTSVATRLIIRLHQNHGGASSDQRKSNIAGRFRISVTDEQETTADALTSAVRQIVSRESTEWTEPEWQAVFSCWRKTRSEWSDENDRIESLLAEYPEGTNQYVVSERDSTRVTHLLERGDFLSPAEIVEPHAPNFLAPDKPGHSRLDFAKWLVDRQSPTAARALVNRVWQAYFGMGIVETSEDLGLQSPPPSHPALLDWLAVEFMDSGWSLKHLHRLITSSATYQQSSVFRTESFEIDPYNRLLWRGPRSRVDAEIVRDIALAASGLLDRRLGGPCIYPPIPRFLILPPASFGEKSWPTEDQDVFRRSLYVQAYRSVPYPPLQVFDAPKGVSACVRRTRSNTPLQALTLLNEQQFTACARALARRILNENADSEEVELIAYAYRVLLSRNPSDAETKMVQEFLNRCRTRLTNGEVNALQVLGTQSKSDREVENELAAWTLTARCLLNLDETITKQ